MSRRAAMGVVALLAVTTLGACANTIGGTGGGADPGPFGACPAAAEPTRTGDRLPDAVPPGAQPVDAHPVAALTLPCFAGGPAVALAELGRPAVINLWASWCLPCRAELPELQRLADLAQSAELTAAPGARAGSLGPGASVPGGAELGPGPGPLVVLGVVTGDTRAAAAAAAKDFGVSFPAVFDPDESLRRSLGRAGLPITLFVDAQGYVRYVYQSGEVLTLAKLTELTRQHLGVVLPAVVGFGAVRSGAVRSGAARFGAVTAGVVRFGAVRSGAVTAGVVRFGAARSGAVTAGVVRFGAARSGALRSGSVTE